MTDTPDDFEWSDESIKSALRAYLNVDGMKYYAMKEALKAAAKAQGLQSQQQQPLAPEPQRCGNCRWWVSRPQYHLDGDCRRYPPKLAIAYDPEGRGPTSIDQHSPVTDANWFCGEYTRHD